jgi:3-oxoacyl-[acyl-carrier protein] reductase
MHLQGKTVLITGASRGIGRAIALELSHQGVQRLILIARTHSHLVEVATEVETLGVEAIPVALDITQTVDVNIAIAQIWRDHGPIHLLINCAGIAHQVPFLQSQLPQMQEEIAINLMGMYTITRLIARRMAVQQQGTIVNVSSLMGKIAAPTMATYSATKFAILGFTQALRNELATHNVRVVALLPSLTDTDMVRNFRWFRWVVPSTPEQVARSLVSGLRKETPEILVGWQSYLAVWGNRLMPLLMEKISRWAAPEEPQTLKKLREAGANSR